jgi:hypothetical protein
VTVEARVWMEERLPLVLEGEPAVVAAPLWWIDRVQRHLGIERRTTFR